MIFLFLSFHTTRQTHTTFVTTGVAMGTSLVRKVQKTDVTPVVWRAWTLNGIQTLWIQLVHFTCLMPQALSLTWISFLPFLRGHRILVKILPQCWPIHSIQATCIRRHWLREAALTYSCRRQGKYRWCTWILTDLMLTLHRYEPFQILSVQKEKIRSGCPVQFINRSERSDRVASFIARAAVGQSLSFTSSQLIALLFPQKFENVTFNVFRSMRMYASLLHQTRENVAKLSLLL